ncbi:hypothetical protein Zmor_005966 [Zophobas morio]|uniref:Uncharacterized protein n=1 Tax=Zophobas morio TaxID=2755281 RepID=A0AA38IQX1_9CUCU|nr:hypothetical protein Zmor_005966 [Zophobas morio]
MIEELHEKLMLYEDIRNTMKILQEEKKSRNDNDQEPSKISSVKRTTNNPSMTPQKAANEQMRSHKQMLNEKCQPKNWSPIVVNISPKKGPFIPPSSDNNKKFSDAPWYLESPKISPTKNVEQNELTDWKTVTYRKKEMNANTSKNINRNLNSNHNKGIRNSAAKVTFCTGKVKQQDTSGNSKIVNKILGATRKKWYYVGRIQGTNITVDDIKNYIADVNGHEDVEVKKLNTQGKNSTFCLGLPTEDIIKVIISQEFWPEGVCLREFNLRNIFLEQKKKLMQVKS